ncbi:MAG: hypothetical protein KC656_27655, partial [Myxococcales bacterium]|nr:hypothetical protein [Myxococcales bacterium]
HIKMKNTETEPLNYIHNCVLTAKRDTPPGYQQVDFGLGDGVRLVVSPDGRDGSLRIGQDVDIWRVRQPAGGGVEVPTRRPHAYVHVTDGRVEIAGALLQPGDGMELTADGPRTLTFHEAGQALVFDLV